MDIITSAERSVVDTATSAERSVVSFPRPLGRFVGGVCVARERSAKEVCMVDIVTSVEVCGGPLTDLQ